MASAEPSATPDRAAAVPPNSNDRARNQPISTPPMGTVKTRAEGMYLCAILHSPALTEAVRPVRPLMSYGKDERHIDKHLWKLPIPDYDPSGPVHQRLADLGQAEADLVKDLDLDESGNFVVLHRTTRAALAEGTAAPQIEEIVTELLGA